MGSLGRVAVAGALVAGLLSIAPTAVGQPTSVEHASSQAATQIASSEATTLAAKKKVRCKKRASGSVRPFAKRCPKGWIRVPG